MQEAAGLTIQKNLSGWPAVQRRRPMIRMPRKGWVNAPRVTQPDKKEQAAAACPRKGRQRRPHPVTARLVHSQAESAISRSRIATIFSMEVFGRDASTHDSHHYNNSTALSRSVANDKTSLDSIGASTIVRITNRTASVNTGGPGFGYVGDSAATCMSPDVGVSNALQRVILLVSQVPPACRTDLLHVAEAARPACFFRRHFVSIFKQ
ncbi:hypothetical protein E2553_03215 [Paraburkholderia dipogonis]|uniref:Uncharacterized protein n=1 Tax=Paraburkholderia dipogonis TaxID=1211383 RepID=A0A4Y8N3E3_9BURK|nr:hypothetical protein [Paraburkholderia dipogonis]TFE44121.1 hypothetical protein E2553_03215 [Paraburkholderia dipogonis]